MSLFFNKSFRSSNHNNNINDTSFFAQSKQKFLIFSSRCPNMSHLPGFSAEIFLADDKPTVFDFTFLQHLSRKVFTILSFKCGLEPGPCIAGYFPISKRSLSVNFLHCNSVYYNSWTASRSIFPSMVSFFDGNNFGSQNKYVQIIFNKLPRLKIWTLKIK